MNDEKYSVYATKSILRSIKPYWLYLILLGKKTLEVGKDRPKSEEWDRLVYLYCSKDKKSFNRIHASDRVWMRKYLGKVAGHFFCGGVENFHQFMLQPKNRYERECLDNVLEKSCLSYDELTEYLKDRDYYKPFYLWEISAFIRADMPFGLETFNVCRPPQSWMYVA